MAIKIKPTLTPNQQLALRCMKTIARIRDKMPYMRPLKNDEPGKKIFSEFIEGFVCDALYLKRAKPNQKGFDAIVPKTGERVQIKETTLSAPVIAQNMEFDFLVTVKLKRKDFSIDQIAVIPKTIVERNLGRRHDFRVKQKEHSKFIVFKNNRWIKKEIQ